MIDYKNSSKGEYIQDTNWQVLHGLTEQWKDSLDFQLFEIEFLQNLVSTYFVKLLLKENLDELRELQRDLYQTEIKTKQLLQCIDIHKNHIVKIIDEPFTFDASVFREEHQTLEDDVSELLRMHKVMKVTTFKMVRDVLQNEEPKLIWKCN